MRYWLPGKTHLQSDPLHSEWHVKLWSVTHWCQFIIFSYMHFTSLYITLTRLPLSFKNEIPGLCSTLFADPSQLHLLVLCNFSRLLLPYTDFFPSPFCCNMQWMCFHFFATKITVTQLRRYTSFSLTIKKIRDFPVIQRLTGFLQCFDTVGLVTSARNDL